MHRQMAGSFERIKRMRSPRPTRRGTYVYHLLCNTVEEIRRVSWPRDVLPASYSYGWEGAHFVVSWEE